MQIFITLDEDGRFIAASITESEAEDAKYNDSCTIDAYTLNITKGQLENIIEDTRLGICTYCDATLTSRNVWYVDGEAYCCQKCADGRFY